MIDRNDPPETPAVAMLHGTNNAPAIELLHGVPVIHSHNGSRRRHWWKTHQERQDT